MYTCGAATDKERSVLKTHLQNSCEIWGEIIAGQLCLQEFTSSTGELVTETTEGHQVFAIVVAAEIPKCVVHGSFCVEERSCAIDVCWEGKKFRVICSHLNPGSVMHMYARDLEDLRMLVTSRVKDAHVHISVDAQTGLGTGIPGAASSNVGPATTVAHRAEKQRLLECFIMEYLLTATNTFSDDDRNANINTCNYNGCHEPPQIDYMLSSDHSLRSRTFDSSATPSDHWGLTATVREKGGKPKGEKTRVQQRTAEKIKVAPQSRRLEWPSVNEGNSAPARKLRLRLNLPLSASRR